MQIKGCKYSFQLPDGSHATVEAWSHYEALLEVCALVGLRTLGAEERPKSPVPATVIQSNFVRCG